ncbi:MAG: tRNA guanosine(34) transglycosylase Tgt [Nitrospirota bacterium]|jgi:queuine tRNA-ribosyltransferase|nr:tRNA guanosine(34) transglycosylase Tgt [Nitrospirota bacterium]MDX2419603.1 tRNA guanosine(34) transglycosylase Tgt [Nitrospirota bacterium]
MALSEHQSIVSSGANSFSVHHISASGARVGLLSTSHGDIETPAFMPVGSQGTVKGLHPDEVRDSGFQMILSNAYHLFLRPGHELIESHGGLHEFMQWPGAILTDSGGYQMVSLANLCEIAEEGVGFRSHINGDWHLLSPEKSMAIQVALGSDIMMVLDHCPTFPCTQSQAQEAVKRTIRWAKRCAEVPKKSHQWLFGIVQGGVFPALRQESTRELVALDMDGYALGGLSLGEEKPAMLEMIETVIGLLPPDRPRYLMGVGLPEDIVEGVARGLDLFDCVIPTRHARTGWLFTSTGRVLIKQARYTQDPNPVDADCECPVCQKFSRAYLRHLFISGEMLGVRLNTVHNLWYYGRLMRELRQAVRQNRFEEYRKDFYRRREPESRETLVQDAVN